MEQDKKEKARDFIGPTVLPRDEVQREQWQQANRSWWECNPMRYDWKEPIAAAPGSREYFEEIDRRLFSATGHFMPYRETPFDPLIEFQSLPDKDVLEIGVGCGSHAALLSRHAKSFTGIDLTEFAVNSASRRFEVFGLTGRLVRMDAEKMEFPDQSFDFIWSWGVIDHSSDTRQVLSEMRRVLRPGGHAITMVFYRSFWQYYVMHGFFNGIVRGDLFKTRSLVKTVQRHTDGALARYYTIPEWKELVADFFKVEEIRVYGGKADLLPLPGGAFKSWVLSMIPDRLTRFISNDLRQGWFLVSRLQRKD
ncbi:MAG TPA: class I SAM-dependent methyltransferase [bacterium]|nr:class I SAM-dependent methyltransferase [bacterium]